MLRSAPAGTSLPLAMSANCKRPPGFNTRNDFGEDLALVGAQIDDAIADHDIGPAILNRQNLDLTLTKLDVVQAHRVRCRPRPTQHFFGHVDADDATFGPDLSSGDKTVETAPGAEIDHPLAGLQATYRERIADTGKSLDRAVRQGGDNTLVIAQPPGQRAPGVEVVGSLGIDRNSAVSGLDLLAQRDRIDG